MNQQEVYEHFLKKFTEEILINLKYNLTKIEIERKEEERRKKEIDSAKLKIKLSEYFNTPGQQKPTIRPAPLIVQTTNLKQNISEPKPLTEQRIKINIPSEIPKPTPLEVDFGKIIFLVRDPLVTYIDCQGENKDIIIRKAGRVFKTQLTLNKQEIDSIIQSFSDKARIPLMEGMLKARFNNLEIAAVISQTSSSFILRKDIVPNRTIIPKQQIKMQQVSQTKPPFFIRKNQ
jgi:hypothetical protein